MKKVSTFQFLPAPSMTLSQVTYWPYGFADGKNESSPTGCLAVGISYLMLDISYEGEPILKPFESMKLLTGRTCLV